MTQQDRERHIRMRPLLLAATLALPLLALGPVPASAHHGWTHYDQNRPMEMTGTVTQVSLQNPHGMAWVEVDGTVWEVVLAPPSRLQNRGLTAENLEVGDTVTFMGYPSRTVEDEIRAEWITVNGTTIQLR